jgi:Fe-S-cluster containining protein
VWSILANGGTPAAALELGQQAVFLADYLISHFEAENQLPHAIACREGCNYCCFNQVEVTPPEAMLIGDYVVRNFSAADREALLARMRQSAQRKAGKSKKKIARQRHRLPCALLVAGRCSVYPVRPLVCRAMHAFEAESCKPERRQGPLTAGAFYAHRYEIVWSISAGLKTGCGELGCQTGVLDLDRALLDWFAATGPAERWVRGEMVFTI